MIHSVEIAFLFVFQTVEARTRTNQADITRLGTIDLWHEFQILKRAERDFWVARRPASDNIAMSLRTASQIVI